MDDVTERWLPVVGWEGLYEVSDLGRVRSLPRTEPWRQGPKNGRILAGTVNSTGAPVVMLRDSPRKRYVLIYVLVAEAFIGPCPSGMEVRHRDDDRLNTRLTNLVYGTRGENLTDAARNGKHPTAKLTVSKVRDIRRRFAAGESQTALAPEYGVRPATIQAVVSRRNWKHVL